MKKMKCPWCGSTEGFMNVRSFENEYRHNRFLKCKTCHRDLYIKYSKLDKRISIFLVLLPIAIYLLAKLLSFNIPDITIIFIALLLDWLLLIISLLITGKNSTAVRIIDEERVPFDFHGNIKITAVSSESAGSFFYNESILSAVFDGRGSDFPDEKYAFVIDYLKSTGGKSFTSRIGFLEKERVPDELIKPGATFDIFDEEKLVGYGEITYCPQAEYQSV